jgi:hypothetical protein
LAKICQTSDRNRIIVPILAPPFAASDQHP